MNALTRSLSGHKAPGSEEARTPGVQKMQGCRDAGNLRCASGMQGCRDADMQGGGF